MCGKQEDDDPKAAELDCWPLVPFCALRHLVLLVEALNGNTLCSFWRTGQMVTEASISEWVLETKASTADIECLGVALKNTRDIGSLRSKFHITFTCSAGERPVTAISRNLSSRSRPMAGCSRVLCWTWSLPVIVDTKKLKS